MNKSEEISKPDISEQVSEGRKFTWQERFCAWIWGCDLYQPAPPKLKQYNTFYEYEQDAQRVMSLDKNKFGLLRDSGVGLVTEVAEVVDVFKRNWVYKTPLDINHLKEEIGDVLWYLALGHYAMGINMADYLVMSYPSKDMTLAKMVRYSSNIMATTYAYPENGLDCGMEHDLRELLKSVFWLCEHMEFDIYEIAAMQTRKMEIRYPNGFDPVKGSHAGRNLAAEAA